MASAAGYRILDEPRPSPWSHLVVNPFWPLLAVMLGGSGLSWAWFVVNGFVLGSPSRWRETLLAVGGVVGTACLFALIVALDQAGFRPRAGLKYAFVGITVFKLAVTYWLFVLQSRPFGIHEYHGGQVANGALPLIAGAFLSRYLFQDAHFGVRLLFGGGLAGAG